MDVSTFTMPYLESLSVGELLALADMSGLDIPPGLERIFIIEELLYWDRDHDEYNGEVKNVDRNVFNTVAVLPEHYNISCVEAIIRDPLWAFVFWEIKTHDREQYEKSADFEGYCLRVIPLTDGKPQADSFVVTVGVNDSARYLGFPPDDGRHFKIELCVRLAENLIVLAASRPLTLPRLVKDRQAQPEIQAVYRNSLAQLSGIDRFSLIHSEDRELRPRGI
jgi:hypothetical protein